MNHIQRTFLFAVVAVLGAAMAMSSAQARGKYWIKVKPKVTGPYSVDATITTNIPDSTILAVNLALRGQKPTDTFFGTSFVRVPIMGGKAKVSIDGSKNSQPEGVPLPKGSYDVEVAFYPMWDENEQAAKQAGISKEIIKKVKVKLSGSGTSVASAKKKDDGQRWVMTNVFQGMAWKPSFWRKKYGSWKKIPYTGSMNPKFLHMYYFKSIDMTLMVNTARKTIATWRLGRKNN